MALIKIPACRTPLSKDGVWIVPVSRVLNLGCLLRASAKPENPRRDLELLVYSLDERVTAFGRRKGTVIIQRRSIDDGSSSHNAPFILLVDVDSGDLRDHEDRPADIAGDRRIAAIADALDAEMLDSLELAWRRATGCTIDAGRPRSQIPEWTLGDLVYWDDVFEIGRQELFVDGEALVLAADMYCVNPACDCQQFTILFGEAIEPEKVESRPRIGLVDVAFKGRVTFHPASAATEARLRALWARYCRRHPELRIPFERYEQLREFAAQLPVKPQSTIDQRSSLLLAAPPRPGVSAASLGGLTDDDSASVPKRAPAVEPGSLPHRWTSGSRKRKGRGSNR